MHNYNEQISQVSEVFTNRKIKNIFFVACGGSYSTLSIGQYIFDRETEIPSYALNSNEFIHRHPKSLGEGSVVILCSHSGNTPETVEATKFARENGATTIIFSNKPDSPLWEQGEYKIFYDWGPESKPSNSVRGMLYRLIFSILNTIQPKKSYEEAIEYASKELSDVIQKNVKNTALEAEKFGETYKRENIIYTMSSGICYPEAYSYAICILQEMQWINSSAIHSGEFFHGPFEITDYDVPFLLIKGLGETRPLDERAHIFLKRFCNKIILIDTAEFDMGSLSDENKGYFANLVAGAVLRQYADQLAEHRGHPLSVRRYMWKLEY